MRESDFNICNCNITIVGLGLIGGSYAMALNKLKPKNLWAIDINKNNIKVAKNMGIIDEGYTQSISPIKDSDIVIICLYPGLTIKFIEENMKYFKSGAIITDTCGLKLKITEKISLVLREDIDFIAAHPMAGRESQGIDYASKDIFNNANYIITPTNKNKKENIDILEGIIKSIGCKNVVKVSPGKHDEIIALTSQLPHIMAIALVNCEADKDINLYTAGSFKDATRVANMNTRLWSELFLNNRENIIDKINMLEANISSIKESIINNDKKLLEYLIEKGRSN